MRFEEKSKEEERKRLFEIIEKELEKQILKKENVLFQLNEPKDISIYKRKGDALLTNQKRLDFSKDKIVVDYLHRNLEIEIDSALSVMENAQKYFEIFKKEKRHIKKHERG